MAAQWKGRCIFAGLPGSPHAAWFTQMKFLTIGKVYTLEDTGAQNNIPWTSTTNVHDADNMQPCVAYGEMFQRVDIINQKPSVEYPRLAVSMPGDYIELVRTRGKIYALDPRDYYIGNHGSRVHSEDARTWAFLPEGYDLSILYPSLAKQTNRCECGAWAAGYTSRSMFHSTWCKEYDDTPKPHVETHEELVQRIRATRKVVNGSNSFPRGKP